MTVKIRKILTISSLTARQTMSSKVESLQRASLRDPVRISVSRKYQTVSTLIQNYIFIPRMLSLTFLHFFSWPLSYAG